MHLSDSSFAHQEYSFEISNAGVNGPLNLEETILSAQTSEPEWFRDGTSFTDIEEFSDTPVKYTLTQLGGRDQFAVRVHVLGSRVNEQVISEMRSHLNRVLGFRDNLQLFYETFADEDDPLSSTFPRLRGLRLMRGTNLYESLICSILSQNNSARLWNRTARLLMKHYGRRADLPDGSTSFLFPKPETIAKLSAVQLRSRTSIGYRAESVIAVSRLIVRNELQLDDLANHPYEEAMGMLLDLPGVGPKVADCFMLYGAGRLEAAPVDVWIHRIVSKFYFRRKKISRLKTARFLRENFGEWAGYAQLYLFDYARRTAVKPPMKSSAKTVSNP